MQSLEEQEYLDTARMLAVTRLKSFSLIHTVTASTSTRCGLQKVTKTSSIHHHEMEEANLERFQKTILMDISLHRNQCDFDIWNLFINSWILLQINF